MEDAADFWVPVVTTFIGSAVSFAAAWMVWLHQRGVAARERVLNAFSDQLRRLWEYSLADSQSRLDGADNEQTKRGQFAPRRPTTDGIIVAIASARGAHALRGRRRLGRLQARVEALEAPAVAPETRPDVAEESEALRALAVAFGRWPLVARADWLGEHRTSPS